MAARAELITPHVVVMDKTTIMILPAFPNNSFPSAQWVCLNSPTGQQILVALLQRPTDYSYQHGDAGIKHGFW